MATIVSDFDGVMTDQTGEALRVRELVGQRLREDGGLDAAAVEALFAEGEAELAARPYDHGWRAAGRITGFANEDLFIRQQGLSALWDDRAAAGDETLAGLRERLAAAGLPSFVAAADWAFEQMSAEVKANPHKPLDPAAPDALRAVIAAGHQVVVVSNSGTDRVLDILLGAGLEAVAHDGGPHDGGPHDGGAHNGGPAEAPLRVRGGAMKFGLGEHPELIEVAGYQIDVARPSYEQILREERPAVVIGDVFSFDLALPLHLARSEPEVFGGIGLVMRLRDYTPAWVRELFEQRALAGVEARLLTAVDQLPGLTADLQGAC